MNHNLTSKASIIIKTNIEVVWDALTNPYIIKQYLFGTNVVTDWKEGSSIIYKGEWQGKKYEDKGIIIKIIPNELLISTYWSSMSSLPDKPENYATVTYILTSVPEGSMLTITQDNNISEEAKNHSEANWKMVLEKMKQIIEK
jgi:uncharacterized protein YndB with AHSA1/START domain